MNQIQTPALPVQSVDYEDNMQFKNNVRVLCSRFQTMLRQRRRKQPQQSKRPLVISAPFNFIHETSALPGISEDELTILREKAAASRIGVAETMCRSPSGLTSHPVGGPMPVRPARPSTAAPRMMV